MLKWFMTMTAAIMLIGGMAFVYMGNEAKAMITEELVAQNIHLGGDAVEFGMEKGLLVDDAKTAEVEAKIIQLHTEGKYGVWTEQDRKTKEGQKARASITSGLPLRNSLNMAVMGYGIANLAMGTGAMFEVMGLGLGGFVWWPRRG